MSPRTSEEDMRICFHGTNKDAAEKILTEGFNVGTYFARHLEDALEFGGDSVFCVDFPKDEFDLPDDWQFHVDKKIPPNQIKRLTEYSPKIILNHIQ